jgi:hypothetical protein
MSENTLAPGTSAEIEKVIVELDQDRQRIVNALLGMAQKAKFSKKTAMEH